MSDLNINVVSPGMLSALEQLDKLDRAQQKLVAKSLGIGTSVRRSSDSGAASLKRMTDAAKGVVVAMGGIASVSGLMADMVSRAKADFEKLKQWQDTAKTSQGTFAGEVGNFIANNPQLTAEQTGAWKGFAQRMGLSLGGAGSDARVMSAVTQVRSQTPGATDAEQMGAIERAVLQAKIDPGTDIAKYATAIVKIQQSNKGSAVSAHNLLSMMGARAGGDVGALAEQIGPLRGAQIAGDTPLEDVMSLFAFLTGELADSTGEQTRTTVLNMLSRIKSRNLKIGGKRVAVDDKYSGEELVWNILDRIEAGEWGTSDAEKRRAKTQIATQLMRGASGTAALSTLDAFGGRYRETRAMMRAAARGDVDLAAGQLSTKEAVLGATGASLAQTRRDEGALEFARKIGGRGEMGRVRERLEMFREVLGMTGAWDFGAGLREWSATTGVESGLGDPTQYEASQKMRWLRAATERRLGIDSSLLDSPEGAMAMSDDQFRRAGMIAGAKSVDDLLRIMLTEGGVSPSGGIDPLEAASMLSGGASPERVEALDQMFKQGQKEAFAEALREVLDELAAAIREGAKGDPQTGIDAGKDVDTF